MDIKTKYDIGEFLYTMHENKIVYGRVTNINVSVYENRHHEEYIMKNILLMLILLTHLLVIKNRII